MFPTDIELSRPSFMQSHTVSKSIHAKHGRVLSVMIKREKNGKQPCVEKLSQVMLPKPFRNRVGLREISAMRKCKHDNVEVPVYVMDHVCSPGKVKYYYRGEFRVTSESDTCFTLTRDEVDLFQLSGNPEDNQPARRSEKNNQEEALAVTTPSETPEQTPEQKPEQKPEQTPEQTPEQKPQQHVAKRTSNDTPQDSPPPKRRRYTGGTAIAACPVTYGGVYYRSTLEGRFAVFMNSANVKFYYEKVSFKVCGHTYTPDFLLPDSNTIIELKPCYPHCEEITKCREVAKLGFNIVLMYGSTFVAPMQFAGNLRHYQHAKALRGMAWRAGTGERLPNEYMWLQDEHGIRLGPVDEQNSHVVDTSDLMDAYQAARTAVFP